MYGTRSTRAEQYSYPKTLGMGLRTPITNCSYSGLCRLLGWTAFSVRPVTRQAYRQSSSVESRLMRLLASMGRNLDNHASQQCPKFASFVVANSFHEKTDPCQEFLRFFPYLLPFFLSQAASLATLPSALLCERFSLGASWVFSIQ